MHYTIAPENKIFMIKVVSMTAKNITLLFSFS